MGVYLNPAPTDNDRAYPVSNPGVKERWLLEHGIIVNEATARAHDCDDDREHALVCLINNGAFTAAAVAYSNRERDAFLDGRGGRQQFWFVVTVNKLGPEVGLSADFPAEYRDKSKWVHE